MGVFQKGKLQSAKPVDPKVFTRISSEVLAATSLSPVATPAYPAPSVQTVTPAAAASAIDAFPIDELSWDERYPAP
jgi:hypothetical protein